LSECGASELLAEHGQVLAQESVLDNKFSSAASEVNGNIRKRRATVWSSIEETARGAQRMG
jgi:hypothetical protein